jgi:dTDP-4-dehydrorhamnose 3,5-epimerase
MKFVVEKTWLDGVWVLTPRVIEDARGYFSEAYNHEDFKKLGISDAFVQDNESSSVHVGTVRGLHFQSPPFAQGKLVRVLSGRIFDVAVDLRLSSTTFGKHVGVELSATDHKQIWIPAGFAHGFITREPNTVVMYKVTAPYDKSSDLGLLWNDPALGINWGAEGQRPVLSDKDKVQPKFADLPTNFP